MKRTLILLSGAALLPLTGSFAQQPPPPPPGGPGGPGPRPLPLIVVIDTDQDGILSAKEIAAAADALKTLDKNGDGQLTPEEYLPPRPEGGPRGPGAGPRPPKGERPVPGAEKGGANKQQPPKDGPPPAIIQALDKDGDGVISATEIAGAPEALKSLDKNGDGQLGPGEYARPPKPPEDDAEAAPSATP